MLALSAALRAGVVTDPWSVVPRALDWCLRRYRLNHAFSAAPWLMQALTAFDRHEDTRELADETLRFQSKVDGAFLTGQQDDCPGCTSVVPLEGLAAVYRAKATPRLRAALEHGLRFVEQRSHLDVGGQRAPSLLGQRLAPQGGPDVRDDSRHLEAGPRVDDRQRCVQVLGRRRQGQGGDEQRRR